MKKSIHVYDFQDLQADVQDHLSNLDYINQTGQELIKKGENADNMEKVDKLKSDLATLNSRWTQVSAAVDERTEKLESSIEQLQQLQVRDFLGGLVHLSTTGILGYSVVVPFLFDPSDGAGIAQWYSVGLSI